MTQRKAAHEISIPDDLLGQWQKSINLLVSIANIPVGLIMRIVDEDIEVFLASQTNSNPYKTGDREHLVNSGLYCEEVIKTKHPLLVSNALEDPRWRNNPDIKLNMISYLGFPIMLPDWTPFGTICILDTKANEYSETIGQLIGNIRDMIQSHLELLHMNAELGENNRSLRSYLDELQVLRAVTPICTSCKRIRDREGRWHSIEEYLRLCTQSPTSREYCADCARENEG